MRSRGAETRTKIAEAALSVLRSHGLGGLSMRKVSTAAGVSLGNLQYHYPSRETLLAGVAEHHLEACRRAMSDGIAAQEDDSDFVGLLVALTHPEVLQVARVFRDLFALAELDENIRAILSRYYSDSFNSTAELLGRAYPAAEKGRIEEVVTLILTAVEGYYLVGESTPLKADAMAVLLQEVAEKMLRDDSGA